MGLLNVGRNLVDGLVNAVSGPAKDSFDRVLKTETARTGPAAPTQDVGELESRLSRLGQSLASTPELRSFIGSDKGFTVRPDGSGFVVARSDGMEMRLPRNSMAEGFARDFNACSIATALLDGRGTVPASECKWDVTVAA